MTKKKFFSLFSLAVLILALVIVPASANVTLYFTDRAFFGNNPITISDYNGTEVFNGTTSSKSIVLTDQGAYWISFEPGGITDMARDPDYGSQELFTTATQFGVGILIVVVVLFAVFGRRH